MTILWSAATGLLPCLTVGGLPDRAEGFHLAEGQGVEAIDAHRLLQTER